MLKTEVSKSHLFLRCIDGYDLSPTGITVDCSGQYTVSEPSRNRLSIFSSKGKFIRSIVHDDYGSDDYLADEYYNDRDMSKIEFIYPYRETFDNEGNLVICDTINHIIYVHSSEGGLLFSIGTHGSEIGQFMDPYSVICNDDGNYIVCDTNNHRIQIFSSKGEFINMVGSHGKQEGQFRCPEGIAIDFEKNYVICDTDNHRIQIFSSEFKFLYSFGSFGTAKGQFVYPRGVAVDHPRRCRRS